ncbi:hypothetical protein UCDDS831_g07873 [Diplodia seriata]|uniref:Uncharacterized protein n=1 Tax=Diplodia seriata TaxID=420778 RepID=A0A0G2DW32_9PEZI|nr:hypothetical protein UCDDS831_g07873 [Diplodia seriata]
MANRDVQIMKATLSNLTLPPKVYLEGIAKDLDTDIDSARDEVNGVLGRLTADARIQIGRSDSSPSSSYSEESPHATSAPVDTVKEEHHVDSPLALREKCDDDAVDALPVAATSHAHVSSPSVMSPPPADGNNSELPLAGSPDRSTAAPAPAPAPALPALVIPREPPYDPCLKSQRPEGEEIEDADDESDWFYEDDDDDDHGKDGEKRTHVGDNSDDKQPPAKKAKKEAAAEETGEEEDDKQTTSGSPMTSSSKLHARLLLAADEAMAAKKEKEAEAAAAAAKEAAALNDTERTVKTALADRLNAADEPADKSSDEPADKPAEEPSSGV